MANSLPPELARLLESTASAREPAWASFLGRHHRLLLHVARSFANEHDAAMDAFAWMLDRLREDDCRRLRSFSADGRSEFSTWLVVVARRLCLDWHRARYGRDRSTTPATKQDRSARRRIIDLVAESIDTAEIPQSTERGPENELRSAELTAALQTSLMELDPTDRLLLKLRFDEGLSAADIAELLRFPTPFHVYRRVTHLLDALRRALRARGVEDPVP